jgi:hypothetical protein
LRAPGGLTRGVGGGGTSHQRVHATSIYGASGTHLRISRDAGDALPHKGSARSLAPASQPPPRHSLTIRSWNFRRRGRGRSIVRIPLGGMGRIGRRGPLNLTVETCKNPRLPLGARVAPPELRRQRLRIITAGSRVHASHINV